MNLLTSSNDLNGVILAEYVSIIETVTFENGFEGPKRLVCREFRDHLCVL
jgi:hypothetical protein